MNYNTKLYKVIEVKNRKLVVCNNDRPDANFMKTGMAFCGYLKPGQSLDEFKAERVRRIKYFSIENYKLKT